MADLRARLRDLIHRPAGELVNLRHRDVLLTLLDVYDLHLAPLDRLDGAEHWQHDPRIAQMKGELEGVFREHLGVDDDGGDDPVGAFRRIAHDDLVPGVYDWLAHEATRDELTEFLALEGGPDADFDDLVALCQIGLGRRPKLTLAANYWDEMGGGELTVVHTELHRRMSAALDLPVIQTDELPLEALERRVLGGFLATNRALQPEMIGALGLLECQAGPRSRRVLTALRRVGAPRAALPFYEVHAAVDPLHGKEWIEHAIVPLVQGSPTWGPKIVRGARWRARVNRRFFDAMAERFGLPSRRAA